MAGNENDCTKFGLYFKIHFNKNKENSCCAYDGINCDEEGYITYLNAGKYLTAIKYDIDSFPKFSRIEQINFGNTGLNKISNSILNLNTLKKLDFNLNEIEVIPPEIQNLSKLEELNISNNNIKELPKELFNLTNLKTLDLRNNHIKEIPSDIQKLSKLEKLYIANNDIKELPKEISNINNIDIHYNSPSNSTPNSSSNSTPNSSSNTTPNSSSNSTPNSFSNSTPNSSSDSPSDISLNFPSNLPSNSTLNSSSNSSTFIIIIGSVIVAILMCIFVITFIIIKKNKSKKSNLYIDDEFRRGSIKVYFNNPTTNIENNNEISNRYDYIEKDLSESKLLIYSPAVKEPQPSFTYI